MNIVNLLSVLVDMAAITDIAPDGLGGDPDAAIRQLYTHYAKALHGYVDQFCPDRASADDIVQETFIRAWHHLPQLRADDRPVRPWLFRVAHNAAMDFLRRADRRLAEPLTGKNETLTKDPPAGVPLMSLFSTRAPNCNLKMSVTGNSVKAKPASDEVNVGSRNARATPRAEKSRCCN